MSGIFRVYLLSKLSRYVIIEAGLLHPLAAVIVSSGVIPFHKYQDFHASCFLFRTV